MGSDLGVIGYDINGPAYVHHINPVTEEMILNMDECLFDLNNLITCSLETHNSIHYKEELIINVRQKGDTKLW